MSDAGRQARLLDDLPRDVGRLAGIVQGLLIHQHVSPAYGVTLSEAQHAEPHIRGVEPMLERIAAHDRAAAGQGASRAGERLVGVCRHFTLLHVAMLRRQGIAARARCGFGAYFEPGKFLDHWVTEYWNEARGALAAGRRAARRPPARAVRASTSIRSTCRATSSWSPAGPGSSAAPARPIPTPSASSTCTACGSSPATSSATSPRSTTARCCRGTCGAPCPGPMPSSICPSSTAWPR